MTTFTECLTGHHAQCPGAVPRVADLHLSTGGLLMCSCSCHDGLVGPTPPTPPTPTAHDEGNTDA